MKSTSTSLTATDGKRLAVRSWVPDAVRVLGSPAPASASEGDEPRAAHDGAVRTDRVQILTAHKAKGLEWDTVAVVRADAAVLVAAE